MSSLFLVMVVTFFRLACFPADFVRRRRVAFASAPPEVFFVALSTAEVDGTLSPDLLVAEAYWSFGALAFAGSCLMMDEYGSAGVDMFDTWIVFGDPSVRVFCSTGDADYDGILYELDNCSLTSNSIP